MYIEVPKVPTEDFQKIKTQKPETSYQVQKRVQAAKDIQLHRFEGIDISANSEMQSKDIKKLCHLEPEAEKIL